MRKLVILAVALSALTSAACHTLAGAGQDVSSVGHAVTDTAHDATPH